MQIRSDFFKTYIFEISNISKYFGVSKNIVCDLLNEM